MKIKTFLIFSWANLFIIYALLISFIFFAKNSYADDAIEPLRPTSSVDYLHRERLPADQSKITIADIINSKDLKGEEKKTEWKLKDLDIDEPDSTTSDWVKSISVVFANFFEYALWILLFVGIVLLFLSRDRWLHLFSSKKTDEESYQAPEILFGMDVREASLPDDIIAEAKLLWQQKKARESLSLLYRGALVRLINQEKILLENSHTEGDILKLSQHSLANNQQQYLGQLTSQWQLIAYAHRIPMDDAMEWLFIHWKSDFAYQLITSTEIKV
ncbi:MAG: hypothetical protein KAH03_05545 [Cocleimonas sp.]|nr:hypothetical protein [Cocleimonas sp.]